MGRCPDKTVQMLEKDVSKKVEAALLSACRQYFKEKLQGVSLPSDIDVSLQVARDSRHGDLASNVAMKLVSVAKQPLPILGERITENFRDILKKTKLDEYVGSVEFAGGFINLRLSEKYNQRLLLDILKDKSSFGRSSEGQGRKVNLEYVSANPTGPLTIAHGRQAAIGDALSRILRYSGYEVTNEYYLNDLGRQISLLGRSVEVRYRNLFGKGEPMPEDGYMGGYIEDIAKAVRDGKGASLLEKNSGTADFFRSYAVDYIMKLIVKDLDDFGVKFDVWTSQAALEKRREVEKVLALLQENGHIYENEGAKWFASTRYGDDKDRVVVKSDGSYTYLAPDMAYHLDKYQRGYDRLIDLLGPDHHGYINRMKSAVQALGRDKSSLDILIVQLVTLLEKGEKLSMSTRAGEFVSLRELMDEIGKDVTRFFFLSRRLDSHLDLDVELAKKESSENPVFYIQYAHARICSIKNYSRRNSWRYIFAKTRLELLKTKEEKELTRKLGEFPYAVHSSCSSLEPNRIIVYLNELARLFHSFYTECRVVTNDVALSKARLSLVECVRIVLANGLGLLNITLPERM